MNLTNYHSHCTFCDGHSPIEDFVVEAVRQGFTSYGVSSHAPLPYSTRWNMEEADMPAYLSEIDRLKVKYRDAIELYAGLEIDYLNDNHCPASKRFATLPLDFRIGSVHTVYDVDGNIHEIDCPFDNYKTIVENYFDGDVEAVVRQYLNRLMRMVELGGFDIVGHADKMHHMAEQLIPGLLDLPWYSNTMAEYFEAIAKRNLIVEMNTKCLLRDGTFYPNNRYYPLLRDLGIRVTVDSDAHFPERINLGRPEGLALLKQAGFTTVAELHKGQWVDVPIEI